ncbi:Zn-dependent hydrolase [Halobacteriales archaeon SW_8_65_20]|nr:MAG: Zn-dependent hydrolase [Halobacteriales archaeon SW_8_65_20]
MEIPDAVDPDRLRADIEANGQFGRVERDTDTAGWGRTAPTGSPANERARDRLVAELDAADCTVSIDAVGNIVGRWEPTSIDSDAAPVAAGSHLDSVPAGGLFDGPLGVYAALEAVRAMQDAAVEPARPIEVVCFTEEEGATFADGLLGSGVAAGRRSVEDALALTDDDGRTLRTALDDAGYHGSGRLDASEWNAWLELHVEQHTELEAAGVPVGVVGDITGITHCDVEIVGETNHAGSTPMDARTDALAAASELALAVEERARSLTSGDSTTDPDPDAVGTVGSLSVAPNATNVIPGAVDAGVDIRSTRQDSIETLVETVRETLVTAERERGVETTVTREFDVPPTPMADRLRQRLRDAGERAGVETLDLSSGAAHDSMHVAGVTDAGMLFAPSVDGLSHTPAEWTDWVDCASATRVLATALGALAGVGTQGGDGL